MKSEIAGPGQELALDEASSRGHVRRVRRLVWWGLGYIVFIWLSFSGIVGTDYAGVGRVAMLMILLIPPAVLIWAAFRRRDIRVAAILMVTPMLFFSAPFALIVAFELTNIRGNNESEKSCAPIWSTDSGPYRLVVCGTGGGVLGSYSIRFEQRLYLWPKLFYLENSLLYVRRGHDATVAPAAEGGEYRVVVDGGEEGTFFVRPQRWLFF